MPSFRERLEDRPLRDKLEGGLDDVPEGPFGKIGGGNLVGAGGFLAVESTKPVIQFIPGVRQPGYKITAHGTEFIGNNTERHTITVAAVSKDVAEFAAEYNAAPSNVDYIRSKIETVEIEEITERSTYSTYKATIDVTIKGTDRGEVIEDGRR